MSESTTPREALAALISTVRFTPVRLAEAYDMGEVDELLDVLAGAAAGGAALGPLIDQGRLTRSRFREGYAIDEVDEFLARLRARDPGMPAVPPAPPPPQPTAAPVQVSVIQEQRSLWQRLFRRS